MSLYITFEFTVFTLEELLAARPEPIYFKFLDFGVKYTKMKEIKQKVG